MSSPLCCERPVAARGRALRSVRPLAAGLIAFVLAGAIAPEVVRGDVIINLPEVHVVGDGVNPTIGILEVTLTLTGSDLASPPLLSSFDLQFSVAGMHVTLGAPLAVTDVATPLFVGGNYSSSTTGSTVKATHDLYDPVPTSEAAFHGAGLVKVPFSVAAGQFGTFALTFGNLNQIANSSAIAIPIKLEGGSITVSAVPEASAGAFAALATAVAAFGAAVRRRRAAAAR